jgi:hypothetical protein
VTARKDKASIGPHISVTCRRIIADMSTSITVLHIQGQRPEVVEDALTAIFAREDRPRVLRIEGTFSAVLRRATAPDLDAGFRYLVLRPHPSSSWTPVLELGNRTDGLDSELSKILGGCAVCTIFVYGDVVSGYRLVRGGTEVDRYLSDPTALANEEAGDAGESLEWQDLESVSGHPERFADLLPAGTAPEDFTQVVLRPGWWERRDGSLGSASGASGDEDDEDEEDVVDEADRMRCIGLALALWAPDQYPFAQDPEDVADNVAGPAIAIAFA